MDNCWQLPVMEDKRKRCDVNNSRNEKPTFERGYLEDTPCLSNPEESVESGQTIENEPRTMPHPLLIEHVVKKILSLFQWNYTNPTMLACRQVCKTWNTIITNGMKRKGLVRRVVFTDSDSDHFRKFLNDMRETSNVPFDSFEFDVHFFQKRNGKLFNEFLNMFSPNIKNLSLKFGKQFSMNFLDAFDYSHINFSDLTTLSFHCTDLLTIQDAAAAGDMKTSFTWQAIHPRELSEGLIQLFRTILDSSNLLTTLDLYVPCRYFEGEAGRRASIELGNILAARLPISVINLKLIMPISGSNLTVLGKRLKVKKLHLDYYGSLLSNGDGAFSGFICSQSRTLTDLRLIDFDNRLHDQPNLPECKSLKVLTVKGNVHFSTLSSFPNLEKLVVLTEKKSACDHDDAGIESQKQIHYPLLKRLKLLYPAECPRFFRKVASHFPNISTLKIQAFSNSIKAIESVFQELVNLIEFEISFLHSYSTRKQPVDNIFTGIPLAKCYEIEENRMYSNDDQSRIVSEIRRRPCLENLKGLQKLTIKLESSDIILTDVTAYYALLRCTSLQEIALVGNHSISSACLQYMKIRLLVTQNGTRKLKANATRQSTAHFMEPEPIDDYMSNWALVPVVT